MSADHFLSNLARQNSPDLDPSPDCDLGQHLVGLGQDVAHGSLDRRQRRCVPREVFVDFLDLGLGKSDNLEQSHEVGRHVVVVFDKGCTSLIGLDLCGLIRLDPAGFSLTGARLLEALPKGGEECLGAVDTNASFAAVGVEGAKPGFVRSESAER